MTIWPVGNGRRRAGVVAWSLAIAFGLVAAPLGCSSSSSSAGGAGGAGGSVGGVAGGGSDASSSISAIGDAGGVGDDASRADAAADPFAAQPVCTSGLTWSKGDHGSSLMNPGLGCIACHSKSSEAPTLTLGGTVYPTAHEPDLCDGATSAIYSGATIVVTGADQKTISLTPNAAGNFLYQGPLALPFHIKLTYMGRERMMGVAQTSGDCNSCHTQDGTNGAPGRILLP